MVKKMERNTAWKVCFGGNQVPPTYCQRPSTFTTKTTRTLIDWSSILTLDPSRSSWHLTPSIHQHGNHHHGGNNQWHTSTWPLQLMMKLAFTDTTNDSDLTTLAEHDALLTDHATPNDPLDLEAFAQQHNLQNHLTVLQKASHLNHISDETPTLQTSPSSKWSKPLPLYLTILATALGAMSQGWTQTGINGANLYWPGLFHVGSKSAHHTFIVGLINFGIYLSNALLGSWLVAPINNRLGRRGAVFVGGVVVLVFNVLSSIEENWGQLLICRLCLGVGQGVVASTLNIFAAECAPATIRGGLGVAWQMFTAFGIFVWFAVNMLVDNSAEAFGPLRWRVMMMAPAAPMVLLLGLVYLCPESPSYWIKAEARYDLAFRSLFKLRGEAAREVLGFYSEQHSVKEREKSSYLKALSELFTIPRIRRATIPAWTTMLAQQVCGINIVAFYSSTIFLEANFTPPAAELASTIFGLVNFLGAFPAIWTMDSLGRRSLLLLTLPFMAMSMGVAGLSFSITNDHLRFGMITSMIYLFCLLYSPGMGPVPPAYSAEVFPLSHRELGTSSAVAVTNLFAAILSLTFPALLSVLGTQGSFLVYALGNLVGWFLVFLFVRETKKKTLEQLDEVFSVPERQFIGYQLKEVVPWWTKRYILMRRNEGLREDIVPTRYSAVEQNED